MFTIEQIIMKQRDFFQSGTTRPFQFRKQELLKLKAMLDSYEKQMYTALKDDLNKSQHEALIAELGVIYSELDFTLNNLEKWMEAKSVEAPFTHRGTKNHIVYEPLGVTLIISPWNYPLQLALVPAIGAIAAGNTVILKPSELAEHTSHLLSKMIAETFDPAVFTVIVGDKSVGEELLNHRFDYIFFTGSTKVGKIIMEKASRHLTPVTLELGGKSPTIVDADANITLSAKRIAWGKLINAGQTCVAPDYLYVHESILDEFLKALVEQIHVLYGKNILKNKNYVRIISQEHFDRLTNYLSNGEIFYGGEFDQATLTMAPTILTDISWDDQVMQEEIFGPILPIIPFSSIDDVISQIGQQEKPLALYYFGMDSRNQNDVIQQTSSGGVCINDTLYHLANPYLPFGGVGQSGFGAYHGEHSFQTFSHQKGVLKQTTKFDIPIRYPNNKIPSFIKRRILK